MPTLLKCLLLTFYSLVAIASPPHHRHRHQHRVITIDEVVSPPTYLKMVYDALATSDQQSGFQNEAVARAVLPTRIVEGEERATTRLTYTIKESTLSNLNRANLILTTREEVSIIAEGGDLLRVVEVEVRLGAGGGGRELLHTSLSVREADKFYSLELDGGEVLRGGGGHGDGELLVEFRMNGTTFTRVFDVGADAPFFLFRVMDLHFEGGGGGGSHPPHYPAEKRRRRSASTSTSITPPFHHENTACTCPAHSEAITMAAATSSPTTRLSTRANMSTEYEQYEVTPPLPPVTVPSSNGTTTHHPGTTAGHDNSNNNNNNNTSSSSSRNRTKETDSSPKHIAKLSLSDSLPVVVPPPSTPPASCKRHEWLVRPGEIGLEDVMRPEFLDLGYCGGSCPFPLLNDVFNFTLHSYFVDQHRFFNGFSTPASLPHSHCVPVRYKKMMVLMREEDGGFAVIVYEDASVESCGCR